MKTQFTFTLRLAVLISVLLHELTVAGWTHREAFARFSFFRPFITMLSSSVQAHPKRKEPSESTITFIETPAEQKPAPRIERSFIETDTSQVTGEEPKNARFYSANSTVAANPENPSGKVGDTPYLNGQETRLASTENVRPQPPGAAATPVPRPVTPPAAPPVAPQPAAPKPVEPAKELAETGLKVGEEKKVAVLEQPVAPPAAVMPTPSQPASQPTAPGMMAGSASPREIATAKSHATTFGVDRIGIAAFNVASSPFGAYDKELISTVQSRWYGVLTSNDKKRMDTHTGTVVLQFILRADGSVANMVMKENSAGEDLGLFCQKAVVESAPFPPYSDAMKQLIGDDAREINFTFYY